MLGQRAKGVITSRGNGKEYAGIGLERARTSMAKMTKRTSANKRIKSVPERRYSSNRRLPLDLFELGGIFKSNGKRELQYVYSALIQ